MDELYGDLENYNEVNTVDELRNENKELKIKLEEYETAMGKLQKDYDNLAMEFNNLQANYSSLLKTARSEVERKAKMITQLNLEKDMMVLKTLQNGNNRRFNINRNPQGVHNPKNASKPASKEPVKAKVDKKAKNEAKKDMEKQERSETCNAPPTVVPSSDSTKLLNISKVVEKVDLFIRQGELKENVAQPKPVNNTPKNRASNIMDRRKSMPAISMPKFSSDEEDEPEKPTEPAMLTELPSVQSPDTRNINTILTKFSDEIRSNKTSETSSIDGRSSNYQESQREGYRGRTNRYNETDRYRDHDRFRDNDGNREGDRFREGDKIRERERYRDSDKYKDDKFMRDGDRFRRGSDKFREYDRPREVDKRDSDRFREADKFRESDRYRDIDKYRDGDKYRGRDKYDPSSRHRKHYSPDRAHKRSYREHQDEPHRPDYNRYKVSSPTPSPILEAHGSYPKTQDLRSHLQERHMHDSEKHQPHHDERQVTKPMPMEHEEPSSKRQKLESDMHVEQSRKQHDKAPPQSSAQKLSRSETNEHEMLRATCQSPDAAHTHTDAPTHTVKEIKTTAVMALEDPRVVSKKYVLKAENGTTTLSTATSNVDIKPVDKSLWNKQQVTIPALLHAPAPTQITDENIKEIYGNMDIDSTEAKVLEPGEIDSDSEDPLSDIYERKYPDKTAKDLCQTMPRLLPEQERNPEPVPKASTTYKIPKKTGSDISKVLSKVSPEQERNQTYKIPKKHNTQSKVPNVVKDLPKLAGEDASLDVKVSRDKKNSSSTKTISKLPQIQKHDNSKLSNNEKHDKTPSRNDKPCEKKKEEVVAISLSDMAMVHDDLELSDETSDNIELHKQVIAKSNPVQSTVQGKFDDSKNKTTATNQIEPAFKIEPLKPNVTAEITNTKADDKPKESETHKKHKTKRRKTRSKEKELDVGADVHVPEKKTRVKKDKEHKPKEVKHKFTDLFGDSNSLITPEDLGIPSSCVPLCEDAQDAIDLDLQEIAKAPCSSTLNEKISNDINTNGFHEETTSNTLLENPNTEDKEIAKRIEEQIASPEEDPSIVYQNLNTEVETDKPNVVKTVIISSGVQPQFEMANRQESTEKRMLDVEVNIQNIMHNQLPVFVDLKKQNSMQALATFTPHKDYAILNTVEPYCQVVESASNANDNKNESANTTGPAADQSMNTTQISNDAPDVRIFVKRRRKGAKKT